MVRAVALGQGVLMEDDAAAEAVAVDAGGVVESAIDQKIRTEMKAIGSKYGGPKQYLAAALSSAEEKRNFAQFLWDNFPEKDDLVYEHNKAMHATSNAELGTAQPLALHLAVLSYSEDCSLKPGPGKKFFNEIVEHFVRDGFVTAGEPLRVSPAGPQDPAFDAMSLWHASPGEEPMPLHSVPYIKGQARSVSILALAHWAWKSGTDLMTDRPVIWESCRVVWALCRNLGNRLEESMENLKLATRGN